MSRRIPTIDVANLRDTISRWLLCTLFGHDYTHRSDPPACIDCGRTRKAHR